jgi:hypothetical protein
MYAGFFIRLFGFNPVSTSGFTRNSAMNLHKVSVCDTLEQLCMGDASRRAPVADVLCIELHTLNGQFNKPFNGHPTAPRLKLRMIESAQLN